MLIEAKVSVRLHLSFKRVGTLCFLLLNFVRIAASCGLYDIRGMKDKLTFGRC